MSKAFTDEESADPSFAGRIPARARPGEERPISPEGHRALTLELARLTETEWPQAKAGGLASEADVRRIEHRIALLEATLASVRIVAPARDGLVRFGARVTLAWEDGRSQIVTLVGRDESDARAGRISIDSPLARSLLGRGVGDEMEVRRPKGVERGSIVAIG